MNVQIIELFNQIYQFIQSKSDDKTKIRIVFHHPDFYQHVSKPFMYLKDFSPEILLDCVDNVMQSNRSIRLDENKFLDIGKGYFHEYENKLEPIHIVFLAPGSRKECDDQSKFICDYENIKNTKNKPKEKNLRVDDLTSLNIPTTSTKSKITIEKLDSNFYDAKIKEVEEALKQKDLKIKHLESVIAREAQINESLRNTFKSDTKIFRRLIVNFIPQLEICAQNCKQLMLEKFGYEIYATLEYIKRKRPNFTIDSAGGELGCLSVEARRKLRDKGYDFERIQVKNTKYFRYEIIQRPEVVENTNDISEVDFDKNGINHLNKNDNGDENKSDDDEGNSNEVTIADQVEPYIFEI
ncbi:unnamed protein product [Brachionus calyciflorus]|uniref:Uncharacterized protein n=1 Tax=Brachionus calyciflorus TaxID=104777 RepID=A0A813V5Z5_9BILA|nr:unnamed protein product [Brachionus calyciflorus]